MTVGSQIGGRRCIGVAHKSSFVRVIWMVLLLQGCTRSPSTNVLGAYYPDWLFCIVGAVAVTVLIRLLLLRASLDEWLDPPAVAYPTLVALLAFAGWLLFF
ncbi:YtcA family lipoprotein [Paraburkholderia sp. GAS42]|uniref:YtcA family lipoprotein n=1 Tax=Paraburkholderia sp. GAS42 TaxID=3035135 RepID=UPI003D21037E